MTPYMQADDLALEFNSANKRKYWKATVGGTPALPVVYFKSRSSMVELTYYPHSNRFAIAYTRVSCSFGDFLASAHKALEVILSALKAAGHQVSIPLDSRDGLLRVEYDPAIKVAYVALANLDDAWQEYETIPFKEPA
jgi:hypothetical protein